MQSEYISATCITPSLHGDEQRVLLAHREYAPCGTFSHYLCQITVVPDDIDEAFVGSFA